VASVRSGLYSRLAGTTAVTTLVGTRIFPNFAPPDATLPYIVYSVVSQGHDHYIGAAAGRATPRVQLDVYDATLLSCETIANVLRTNLDGFSGTLGSSDTVECTLCMLDNEIDLYEPPAAGENVGTYHIAQDYLIHYVESVPTF